MGCTINLNKFELETWLSLIITSQKAAFYSDALHVSGCFYMCLALHSLTHEQLMI